MKYTIKYSYMYMVDQLEPQSQTLFRRNSGMWCYYSPSEKNQPGTSSTGIRIAMDGERPKRSVGALKDIR
jgi:nitrate reductase alpha subunit